MSVESASYISQLDPTNPNGSSLKSEGDNQIRLLKSVLQTSFPNVSGAVTVSHVDLNNITTTQPSSENSTKPATTAFVKAVFATVPAGTLPALAGNAGKPLVVNGGETGVQWGSFPTSLTLAEVQAAALSF